MKRYLRRIPYTTVSLYFCALCSTLHCQEPSKGTSGIFGEPVVKPWHWQPGRTQEQAPIENGEETVGQEGTPSEQQGATPQQAGSQPEEPPSQPQEAPSTTPSEEQQVASVKKAQTTRIRIQTALRDSSLFHTMDPEELTKYLIDNPRDIITIVRDTNVELLDDDQILAISNAIRNSKLDNIGIEILNHNILYMVNEALLWGSWKLFPKLENLFEATLSKTEALAAKAQSSIYKTAMDTLNTIDRKAQSVSDPKQASSLYQLATALLKALRKFLFKFTLGPQELDLGNTFTREQLNKAYKARIESLRERYDEAMQLTTSAYLRAKYLQYLQEETLYATEETLYATKAFNLLSKDISFWEPKGTSN